MSAIDLLDQLLAEQGAVQTHTLEFEVTCPACGGPVELVTYAAPEPTEAKAIVRCRRQPAHHNWLVWLRAVRCASLDGHDAHGCGTESGYQRHRRNGESACSACISAHQRWQEGEQAMRQRRRRVVARAEP